MAEALSSIALTDPELVPPLTHVRVVEIRIQLPYPDHGRPGSAEATVARCHGTGEVLVEIEGLTQESVFVDGAGYDALMATVVRPAPGNGEPTVLDVARAVHDYLVEHHYAGTVEG